MVRERLPRVGSVRAGLAIPRNRWAAERRPRTERRPRNGLNPVGIKRHAKPVGGFLQKETKQTKNAPKPVRVR
jgi:hypothetical protein